MKLINPIMLILFNEADKKYYPAIASENVMIMGSTVEKFAHLFRGRIATYFMTGYTDFETVKEAVLNELMDEIDVGGRVCVNGFMAWNGSGQPAMDVFMELQDGAWCIVGGN